MTSRPDRPARPARPILREVAGVVCLTFGGITLMVSAFLAHPLLGAALLGAALLGFGAILGRGDQ